MLKRILETMPVSPNQVTVSRLVISGVFLLLVQAALGESGLLVAALSDGAFQRAAIALGIAYYLELILWFYAMSLAVLVGAVFNTELRTPSA